MSTTELDEVQALLERVLPDPTGYAQRLLLQAMAQWGQLAEAGSDASKASASTFYTTTAEEEDVDASNIVITPDQPADRAPADTSILLAGALGACVCWGLQADCDLCRGQGSAGWTEPIPELFDEFIGPAIARLPDVSVANLEQYGGVRSGEDSDNHQTVGEDA